MRTGVYCGIIASSKTRVRCVYCGVHIPKANKCIEQHANGARHMENVELTTENGIIVTASNILYCKPCSIELLLEDSVVRHTLGPGHSYWITAMEDAIDGEYITLRPYLSDTDRDNAYCQICHIPIYCTLQNIKDHVNSITHKSSVLERVKPLHGIFPVDDTNQAWCKICNVNVDNRVEALLEHLVEEWQHMYWYVTIELSAREDIILQSFLADRYEMNAYCSRCRMVIKCSSKNVEDHVLGEVHRNYLNTI